MRRAPQRALTLLETMAVIAVMGILIALVAPSMREMIGMQRLRSISAELVTDFQYARSEAVSRNQFVGVLVRNTSPTMSCYTVFASSVNPLSFTSLDPTACDCSAPAGSVCTGTQRELRTVQVPRSLYIELRTSPLQPTWMAFDPVTGAIQLPGSGTATFIATAFCVDVMRDTVGRVRAMVGLAGRSSVCTPDGSVRGLEACQPYDANLRNCLPWS
jgi:type IV fimbrial biogenesis protein FimT